MGKAVVERQDFVKVGHLSDGLAKPACFGQTSPVANAQAFAQIS